MIGNQRDGCATMSAWRGLVTCIACGCAAAFVSSCGQKSSPPQSSGPPADVVAVVGNHEIKVSEFQDWMLRRGVGTNDVAREALLKDVITHNAALQRAIALGLDKQPEFRRSWENMLVSRLRERELEPRLTNAVPTYPQIETAYSNQVTRFTDPALRRGAMLMASYPAKANEEAKAGVRKRLESVRAKALEQAASAPQTRGFGPLAIEFSEDQSTRYKGGDIGWMAEGRADNRVDSAVTKTLFSLSQTNEISEIVETPQACYLVKWTDFRPAKTRPLEAVRAAVQHRLQLENRQRLEAAWSSELLSNLTVQVYREALLKVPAPAQSKPQDQEPPGNP